MMLAVPAVGLGQHALTADTPLPLELEGCNLCHGPHGTATDTEYILRPSPEISAWTRGLDRVSATCLRCHSTPSIRAGQPEFRDAPAGASGGAFLEMDLGDDHPLGVVDPHGVLADPGPSVATRPGFGAVGASALVSGGTPRLGCTTCHDPHDRNGSLPSWEDERFLCLSCHDPGRYAHDRHADLRCSSCHDVHQGRGSALLKRPTGDDVCSDCHGPGGTSGTPAFEALASRRARLFGAVAPPASPAGHAAPPTGRCLDCHPVHR